LIGERTKYFCAQARVDGTPRFTPNVDEHFLEFSDVASRQTNVWARKNLLQFETDALGSATHRLPFQRRANHGTGIQYPYWHTLFPNVAEMIQ
jgi:hypothetical protein